MSIDLFRQVFEMSWSGPLPAKGQVLTESEALRLALYEGAKGWGTTSPNPAVGCVVLDADSKLLACGYHAKAGGPHAEVVALNQLTPAELKGAQVFTTLEPCAHQGRTPSCAQTLAKLPIARVVSVLKDPNPLVAGKGFQILHEAGIQVQWTTDLQFIESAKTLCEFFLRNQISRRPFVSLKVATSWDGMSGLKSGESSWITGETARLFARHLRGGHDAVFVGKSTVLLDNPILSSRETIFSGRKQKLVIFDSTASVLQNPQLKIFSNWAPEDMIIVCRPEVKVESPFSSLSLTGNLLTDVLAALMKIGVSSVWVEGGPKLYQSFLQAQLVDRLWLFHGPHLLGGGFGQTWTGAWGGAKMSERVSGHQIRRLSLGDDLLQTARIESLVL